MSHEIKAAVAEYISREPKWIEDGRDPATLVADIAQTRGVSEAGLSTAISNHFDLLGA